MKCVFCKGEIEDDAKKCKHCSEWQTEEGRKAAAKLVGDAVQDADNKTTAQGCLFTIVVVIVIGIIMSVLKSCG